MPLSVQLATPRASNVLRVAFNLPIRQTSRLGLASSLLRSNYEIAVLSGTAEAPVVEIVEAEAADAVLVRTDRRLLVRSTYRVTVSTDVVALDGSTMAPPANQADFPGITLPIPRVVSKPTSVRRGVDLRYDDLAGTFVLDSAGDIDTQEGADAAQKRVVRRLISSPGGFRHLDDYGAGLRVKEPFRTTDLAEARLRILDQIREERDVRRANIDLETAPGVLYVRIQAQTGAEPFSVEVPIE